MLFQKTFVVRVYRLQRIAVDNDDRWIHPALVRITQLRTDRTLAARLLMFDCLDQGARQLRRGQIGHRGSISGIDRFHHRAYAAGFQRRDEMHLRKRQKAQLALQIDLDLVAPVAGQAIPFIDAYHQRPARLQYEAGNVRILFGNILLRIQQ